MTDTMFYSIHLRCTNCAWVGERRVHKGTTLDLFLNGALCPCCGCETLVQKPHIGRYDIDPNIK